MQFQFNVKTTEQDYLDFNMFWMLKSPYGKKQTLQIRVTFLVVFALMIFLTLFEGAFSKESLIESIPYWVLCVVFQLLTNKMIGWLCKAHIKSMKKKGKMGYSPIAKIEFGEESFTETTPENKTEAKYSSVERVSVCTEKAVYIHVNNVMAYILPITSFSSREEYQAFIAFLSEKNLKIDTY